MRDAVGSKPRLVFFLQRPDADFFTQWDWMDTHPLGGSESSALHLAREFRARGFDVLVTNRLEDLRQPADIFISLRMWEVFHHGIRPGRLNYLWCTDDSDQPGVAGLRDPAIAARVYHHIDGAIMLSDYQVSRWRSDLHLPVEKIFQTTNGIPANRFASLARPPQSRGPVAYYGSTPFRGLAALLQRWPQIRRAVPRAELHIFSSMQIYGIADPAEFAPLYAIARTTPGIHYHGAQGQTVIRATISECRALAYPCTFPETSCITAMEAMAAGCAVISTAIGALPETAAGNPLVPPDAAWLDRWQEALIRVLTDDRHYSQIAARNLAHSSARDWGGIAARWIKRFAEDRARRTSRRAPGLGQASLAIN